MENKNRLEIRLDPDSQQLLDSLIARTNLTKTSLIKKALIVYASTLKKGHVYTVKLKTVENNYTDLKISNEDQKEIDEDYNFDDELKKINEEMPYKY